MMLKCVCTTYIPEPATLSTTMIPKNFSGSFNSTVNENESLDRIMNNIRMVIQHLALTWFQSRLHMYEGVGDTIEKGRKPMGQIYFNVTKLWSYTNVQLLSILTSDMGSTV